jgi:hypothetical protein
MLGYLLVLFMWSVVHSAGGRPRRLSLAISQQERDKLQAYRWARRRLVSKSHKYSGIPWYALVY